MASMNNLTPFNPLLHFLGKRITQGYYSSLQYDSRPSFLQDFPSNPLLLCLSITSPLRFQKYVRRNEILENGPVDSKLAEYLFEGSFEMEMDVQINGKTGNSVSVEDCSEFTCVGENFDMDNVDCALSYVQFAGLDVDSKGGNSGGLESSKNVLDVCLENNASNVFDLLPEPEVQLLWGDYPVSSDSESAGDSNNGSPMINHDRVDDSSCKELESEKNKQLETLNHMAKKEEESVNVSEKSTEILFQDKPSILNYDHGYELNYLPDHQDIVKQLEMELKNARTGGLPTIFEEDSQTAEAIKEKFMYEEVMGEIQNVYKTYEGKMWKLDILNHQSMHVIGLLQLKNSLLSVSAQNSQLLLGKARRLGADPRLEFIGDLLTDIEMVYVGQVCLSWEILQWQLRKSLELQRYDSQGVRQYSQVASEFQLFQVMLKRFMEEEWFQGNRVENYVENRCIFHYLLQVPPIKDDGSAEAVGREWEDDYDSSSNCLVEIIEKSMRVFYDFLLSDKYDVKNILKCNRKHQIELQNSRNPQLLLVNVQAQFQKAERKLKDLLRGNNRCSLEKFRKQEEAELSYSLILLIAQVDLKLISRVLRMTKLTVDQLLWCNQKLDQLIFPNRKLVHGGGSVIQAFEESFLSASEPFYGEEEEFP